MPETDALCLWCCKDNIGPSYVAIVDYPTVHGPDHLGYLCLVVLQDFPEFGRWSELRWVGGLTFTPLNSYLYNSDNSNLARLAVGETVICLMTPPV